MERKLKQQFKGKKVSSNLVLLPRIMPDDINVKVPFVVIPSSGFQRGVAKGIIIHKNVFLPLCKAQYYLKNTHPNLIIILKRGFFPRDFLLKAKEKIAKGIFTILYPYLRNEASKIFSNEDWGHHEGVGIDLGLYNKETRIFHMTFLPPLNAFSSKGMLEQYKRDNPKLQQYYKALCKTVNHAGFIIHPNEIEARQMHVILKQSEKGK